MGSRSNGGTPFEDFKSKDKIEVGRCLVPNAIDDYLKFDRRKFPVKYKRGHKNYWDREGFKEIPDSLLEKFGELYLLSIEKGLDLIEIGQNIYELGSEYELPGFTQKNTEKTNNGINSALLKKFRK